MKFLCVLCDQAMKLVEMAPPDRGALAIVYECPECAHRVAMLTNPLETQVVTSLGVQIGPGQGDIAKCPFSRHGAGDDRWRGGRSGRRRQAGGRVDERRARAAPEDPRLRAADGALRHREVRRRTKASPRSTRRCSTMPRTSSACDDARAGHAQSLADGTDAFARPYVISWNLTYRCNLACEHCYLDAGGKPAVDTPAFADRSELDTAACFRVVDEIAAFAPDGLLILTGGEPLLRRDIVEIIRYAAAPRALGRGRHERRQDHREPRRDPRSARACAGCRSRSTRSTQTRHDAFRRVTGAFRQHRRGREDPRPRRAAVHRADDGRRHNVARARRDRRLRARRARRQGLEPLLPRADRARRRTSPTSPTPSTTASSASSPSSSATFAGRMLVNAKCAPHYVRILQAEDPTSPFLKSYAGGAGGCPAGTHYMRHPAERRRHAVSVPARVRRQPPRPRACARSGARPTSSSASATAQSLGGRCGVVRAQRRMRRLPRARLRHDRRRHGGGRALHARSPERCTTVAPPTLGIRCARGHRDRSAPTSELASSDVMRGTRRARAHEGHPGVRTRHGDSAGRSLLPRPGHRRASRPRSWRRSERSMPTPKLFGMLRGS